MNKVIALFLLFLISGCATPSKNLQSTIDDPEHNGMLLGTISLEDRKFFAAGHYFYFANDSLRNVISEKEQDYFFRKFSGKVKTDNRISILNASPDFKEGDKWVYLFNLVRPAGAYSIYEVEIYSNSGTAQSSIRVPVHIPFEIEPGKISYIGEINFKGKTGHIQVLDQRERDRARFKEKAPDIDF